MGETNIRNFASRVIDLSPLAFEAGVYFNPIGNFSLLKLPNGNWLCSLRRFGYYISTVTQAYLTNPSLKLSDPDNHLLLELDRDFNFVRKFDLVRNEYYRDSIFNKETPYLEDGRLVQWGDSFYMTSAIFYQNNEHYQKFGMEVQRIDLNGSEIEAKHVWSSVESGILGRHKNWMPIPDKPYKFISATYQNGSQIVDISSDRFTEGGICDGEMYRGNTPLLKTDNGYLTITHKLTGDDLGRKRYVNFFVRYDESLNVVRISKPFKLCDSNIEFVTTLFEDGGKLFVGVTEMDDTPFLMEFDKSLINSLWSN